MLRGKSNTTSSDLGSCQKGSHGDQLRVAHIVTAACTTNFMRGQLAYLRSQGYQVTVIASPNASLQVLADREGIEVLPVKMEREINPFQDVISLFKLFLTLRKLRPHVVNASTPKAGLLGMLCACLLRVPLRIYTLRGLRLETTHRLRRFVLYLFEGLTAACAHRVVCVSESLREAYLELNCTSAKKAIVIGAGSSNGVDAKKFRVTPHLRSQANKIRRQYNIPNDALVIGFVGRLTRDKGVEQLLEVFEKVKQQFLDLRFLVVGDFEEGDRVDSAICQRMLSHSRIHVTGMVDVSEVGPYYRVLDLLLFPSRREGFPNAVLEAQASELPVVGYSATGTIDAIDHGKTGLLVPMGDCAGLTTAVTKYLADETLRIQHGRAARLRVEEFFRPETVWEGLGDLYHRELGKLNLTTSGTRDVLKSVVLQ